MSAIAYTWVTVQMMGIELLAFKHSHNLTNTDSYVTNPANI